jgi:acyl-CoA synthetase (NDP forming)
MMIYWSWRNCLRPVPEQSGVAVVSHSGGVSSLVADMLGQAAIAMPPLTTEASMGIDAILKGFGSATNPADITGHANGTDFPEIMRLLIDQPGIGTLVIASAGDKAHIEQVIALRDRTHKSVVYMWTGSRLAQDGLNQLKDASIPIFYSPDSLARGLKFYLEYYAWRARDESSPMLMAPRVLTETQQKVIEQAHGYGRSGLSESESKKLIAAWGVPIAREISVFTAGQAVNAATELGYPVVLKVESPDIMHKTEAGIVRLNLRNAQEVQNAFIAITQAATNYDTTAVISGVLVQEMVQEGVEVIVGLSYDAQLGPVLLFGSGGVTVEIYNDVALRRCPVSSIEARDMIGEVKGAQLLQGFRGKPPADIDALIQVLVNVSHMGIQLQGSLKELDINPLLVLPKGQGVKAVDALVILAPTGLKER